MMKMLLSVLAVALLGTVTPETAQAQCGGMCSRLVKETGEALFGCYYAPGSRYSCQASETRCQLIRCANALLTTPEGRVVGQLACAADAEPGRTGVVVFGLPALLFVPAARPMEVAASSPPPLPTGSL